jgi:UDP-N-acetylglucosamine 2-epimerase
MLDAMQAFLPKARLRQGLLDRLGLEKDSYCLATIHRAATTDNPQRLGSVISALNQIGETIVFPVHPRTRSALENTGVKPGANIRLIDPVGYLDMLVLEENARVIATDSGGVQREAYFLKIPCLTLRDETEWRETVTTGWNRLVGTQEESILAGWNEILRPAEHPPIFGDGTAGEKIVRILEKRTS